LPEPLVKETLQNLDASKFFFAHSEKIAHISAPFPDSKIELQYHERGHFYFGERGHYYFGLTCFSALTAPRIFLKEIAKKSQIK